MSGFGSAIKGSLLFTVLGLIFLTPWALLRYLGSWYTFQWYVNGNAVYSSQMILYYTIAYLYAVIIYGTLIFMTLNKFFNDSYLFGTSVKSMLLFLVITIIPFTISTLIFQYAGYFEPYTFTWRINNNIQNPSTGFLWVGILLRAIAFLVYAPFFVAGLTAALNKSLFDIGEEFADEDYDYEY